MMYTDGAQCTANFVYTDAAGNTYVGYAAHCAGTGRRDRHQRLQHRVPPARHQGDLQQGRQPGRRGHPGRHRHAGLQLLADHAEERREGRQHLRLQRPGAGQGRAPRDVGKVNPSVPFWGGPTGIDTDGTAAGDRVCTYGNSSLRAGVEPLSPHTGVSLGDDAADGGWSHPLYTVTPGIPGDSGSGFLSADGKAVGVLSTVGLAPLAGLQRHRRPGQGARLRAGPLRHRRAEPGQRHGAVLAGPLSRRTYRSRACSSGGRGPCCVFSSADLRH